MYCFVKNLFSKLTLTKVVLFLHGLPKKGDNMKCLELTRKFKLIAY